MRISLETNLKYLSAISLTFLCLTIAHAQTFTQVVAFGDSLSDVGNVNNQTFGISPGSGYYNGRFSNGSVWIENVATNYALAVPTYSRSGGKDYAYGGVKTGTGNTTYVFFNFPNIGTQINSYLGGNTPSATTLYSVWGGGNDLMDNLSVNTQAIVNNLVNHVTALNNAGARFAIVPNLPPLGEIPKYRNTANRAAYNALSGSFNSQLAAAMTSLDAQLPIKVYQLDVERMFTEVLANPSAYGFTNVTSPAMNNAANPDQYLFWDDVHPTRIGHRQVAGRVTDLIDTHDWIGGSGAWSASGNWDVAGVPASNWIASLKNASANVKESIVSANSTVRQLQLSGTGAEMRLTLAAGATLNVTQALQVSHGGTLRFQLAGAASQGQLNTASAALNGAIEIGVSGGFIPLPGSTYTPLTYTSRTGSAAIVNATGFAGLSFDPAYSATALSLTAQAAPGDANLDALINSLDFNALIGSFGSTSSNWLSGDFTGEGKTDSVDFNLLAGNFGVAPSLGTRVPEPVTFAPLLALLACRRARVSV